MRDINVRAYFEIIQDSRSVAAIIIFPRMQKLWYQIMFDDAFFVARMIPLSLLFFRDIWIIRCICINMIQALERWLRCRVKMKHDINIDQFKQLLQGRPWENSYFGTSLLNKTNRFNYHIIPYLLEWFITATYEFLNASLLYLSFAKYLDIIWTGMPKSRNTKKTTFLCLSISDGS